MEEVSKDLELSKDMISAGPGNAIVKQWYDAYGELYDNADAGWKWK